MPEQPKVVGIVGNIGPLNPKSMEWSTYKGRFSFYLQANGITDEALKRATLQTLIKDTAYRMLADLHQPDDLSTVNFDTDLDGAYGKNKSRNWHLGNDSNLSFSTRVNQSTSISRTFVIHPSIAVSAINSIIASKINL